ncbi:hypothetical protein ACQUFO_14520 [Enterococcus casseliflavus]|uniref:hypothetical protein n=1 Tax=Enterococcus casseliflavus TaxID=37734 RepID=UPI0029559EE8|nr:hypothetical protein [Enterococcus casseliflavus]
MWLLMKWIVKKDDLENYRAKFHGKLAGYAEEAKMIALPTPKYFIVVVDEEKIHLIQLDLQFHEKGMQTIMIHEITKLQLGGVVNKKVQIQTPSTTVKLMIKPLAIGIKEEQKALIDRFTRMSR